MRRSLPSRWLIVAVAPFFASCGSEEHLPPLAGEASPPPPAQAGEDPEPTVERRERWLGAHQSPDGRWEAAGFDRWQSGRRIPGGSVKGLGKAENDVAVTALAVLVFVEAGYSSNRPESQAVIWGLRWLRSVQEEDGCFGSRSNPTWAVQHALATFAMTADAQDSREAAVVASAQRAIDFAADSLRRGEDADSWESRAGPGGVEPVAWMMLAFHAVAPSGKAEGKPSPLRVPADVDAAVRQRVAAWVDDPVADARVAAGTLALLMSGEDSRGPRVRALAERLDERRPTWALDGSPDFTHSYFATNALFRVGGEPWKRWNEAMTSSIVANQRMDTDHCRYKGSWDPIDRWGMEGGRVYSTAILALCLEVYYRYDKVYGVGGSRETSAPPPRSNDAPRRIYGPCADSATPADPPAENAETNPSGTPSKK